MAATTNTRDTLLDAAWHLAERHGLAQVTLAQIGAAAGMTRQTVYLHFGSRAGLLVDMARHRDRSSRNVRKMMVVARARPGRASIERFVRAWFGHAAEIVPVARAIEAAAAVDADAATAWRDRMDAQRELIRQLIDRLADAGRLSKRWTREEAVDWFWSRIHLDVWQQLVVERGWPRERVVSRVAESLWMDLTNGLPESRARRVRQS